MADPNAYYFEPPQNITFTKNQFRAPLGDSFALMYYLEPGCSVLLQIYCAVARAQRAAAINDVPNYSATGTSRTIQGIEGKVVSLFENPWANHTFPWAPALSAPLFDPYFLAIPHIDPFSVGPSELNGVWVEGTPLVVNPTEQYEMSSGPPSNTHLTYCADHVKINMFSSIKAIENGLFRDTQPLVIVYSQIVTGTGCVSSAELETGLEGFAFARTEVITTPPNVVAHRSTPSRVYECGFLAWGAAG